MKEQIDDLKEEIKILKAEMASKQLFSEEILNTVSQLGLTPGAESVAYFDREEEEEENRTKNAGSTPYEWTVKATATYRQGGGKSLLHDYQDAKIPLVDQDSRIPEEFDETEEIDETVNPFSTPPRKRAREAKAEEDPMTPPPKAPKKAPKKAEDKSTHVDAKEQCSKCGGGYILEDNAHAN